VLAVAAGTCYRSSLGSVLQAEQLIGGAMRYSAIVELGVASGVMSSTASVKIPPASTSCACLSRRWAAQPLFREKIVFFKTA
jgi:hypothetical protein